LVCLAVIITTVELAKLSGFKFIADHRDVIVSIELAIFVMALVEFIGRIIIVSFRRRGIEPMGHSIRTIIRGGVYIVLTVGIISTLLSNPALAITFSTVIAVIIGFATQNLIGNVAAGILLAIVRPVRVGDQVTISGSTGRVKDIALIYTVLDAEDSEYYVPSILMFSNVVMKKKSPENAAR
ncbi:MAG TPA: mechanosensitive ion channel domain-containing protein, partial [Dehalococcoidales bacterium]